MFNKEEWQKNYRKTKKGKFVQLKYRLNHPDKIKEWKEINKEKTKLWFKFYYLKNKEKIKLYLRNYYLKNKDKIKRNKRKYYKDNTDKVKTYNKKYKKENRELYRKYESSPAHKLRKKLWAQSPKGKICYKASCANRRALTKDLTTLLIKKIYKNNLNQYGVLTCYLCLKPIGLGLDCLEHKTPLSRGGTNAKENLDVACKYCNSSKRNKTLEEFRLYKNKND